MTSEELVQQVNLLLARSGRKWQEGQVRLTALMPDGSSRRFYRLEDGARQLIAVLPPEQDGPGQAEARAFACIGNHLQECGAATPAIFGFDADTGLALCEDLGADRLYEKVQREGLTAALPEYEETVRELARLQVRGARGFDSSWCWDTSRYDRQVMLERESGYFLRACCNDFLHLVYDHDQIDRECRELAETAGRAPANFFLHRDFQSRNIMLHEGRVRFIDFQGGRLGPLAYDLASLLIDPYTALPAAMQDHLRQVYFEALSLEITYDRAQFEREYQLLALQRNLQIIGAFAFLSQVRRKPFFAQFLVPALDSLAGLLAKPEAARYAGLRQLCLLCQEKCREKPAS